MKRILCILLSLVLFGGLSGCGAKAPAPDTLKEGETLWSVFDAVDAKFAEKYGADYAAVSMGTPVDELYLSDFLALDPASYEEFAGNVSMSMTNSDALFAVRAAEGQVEAVEQAFAKRLTDLRAQYEFYPVNGSYERAMAGEVFTRGNYVFLIVVGPLADPEDESPDFSGDVKLAREIIDQSFND